MSQDVYLRKDCRMCCSKSLVKVMELNPTPPGNNFIKKLPVDEPEVSYPLDLVNILIFPHFLCIQSRQLLQEKEV